jgi:cellulose synthase/poly-beta-1,6-N-acetylglucosamine synthase-like glycosyltransferase
MGLLWTACGLVSIPILVFFVECLASLRNPRARGDSLTAPPAGRLAVLIPAHNEEDLIASTIEAVLPQLSAPDRLVVIADNCTDQTANRARGAGAGVFERQMPDQRGKVAALAFGLERLAEDPPDVVLFVDADTRVEPGSVAALRRQAMEEKRPVQAIYTMSAPLEGGAQGAFSALAFAIKNLVRPRGLARLGLPCPLTGTGMAIPWELIKTVPFAKHSIVEDMQLGIDLAIAGYPARLCEEAMVTGLLPSSLSAASLQRRRWEHGHLGTILSQVPRLVGWSLRKGSFRLLAMALDLAVPPLALLCLLWFLVLAGAAVMAARTGYRIPLGAGVGEGLFLGGAVLAAWGGHLRNKIPFITLLWAPFYIFWKIPLYLRFVFARERKWVRTPREGPIQPQRPGDVPPSP